MEKRTKPVHILFTQKEHTFLKGVAKLVGLKFAPFVRNAAIKEAKKIKKEDQA